MGTTPRLCFFDGLDSSQSLRLCTLIGLTLPPTDLLKYFIKPTEMAPWSVAYFEQKTEKKLYHHMKDLAAYKDFKYTFVNLYSDMVLSANGGGCRCVVSSDSAVRYSAPLPMGRYICTAEALRYIPTWRQICLCGRDPAPSARPRIYCYLLICSISHPKTAT